MRVKVTLAKPECVVKTEYLHSTNHPQLLEHCDYHHLKAVAAGSIILTFLISPTRVADQPTNSIIVPCIQNLLRCSHIEIMKAKSLSNKEAKYSMQSGI